MYVYPICVLIRHAYIYVHICRYIDIYTLSISYTCYVHTHIRRAGFRATLAALGAEDVTGIDIDGDGQVYVHARMHMCL